MKPDRPKSEGRDRLAGLVQNVSVLGVDKMNRAAKAMKLFLNAEKKGATRLEAFQESSKAAEPGVESGVFRRAGGEPAFELNDQGFKIKPEVEQMFQPGNFGSSQTPRMSMADATEHPELFSRMPEAQKATIQFTRPGPPQSKWDKPDPGGGGYGHRSILWKGGPAAGQSRYPTGEIDIKSRAGVNSLDELSTYSARDLLGHEGGGHLVQDLSGFGRGDSPENMDMYAAHDRLVHPRILKYHKAITDHFIKTGLSPEEYDALYPEASLYLAEADRLVGPKARNPKLSALDKQERYENVSNEEEARRVADRMDWGMDERNAEPIWTPEWGRYAPYEFQMIRDEGSNYRMSDDRGVLARLLKPPQGR